MESKLLDGEEMWSWNLTRLVLKRLDAALAESHDRLEKK